MLTQNELRQLIVSMLDNTAPKERYWELGIFKFAKTFFPDRFKDDFAPGHYDMVMLLFTLLDPQYEYQSERQGYLLIHREASKSTIGTFLFPIYLIYCRGLQITARVFEKDMVKSTIKVLPPLNENFILIASKTKTAAENFVVALRDEITIRKDLSEIFGNKDPRQLNVDDDTDKMWRRSAFMTADNTIVVGVGAGQQARGTNLFGSRPVFAIVDDMYDKNNIKTEDTRENIRYWFHAELLNSLDSRRGKCLWLGTLLHPDTVVKDFEKDSDWFGVKRPLIAVDDLTTVVNECTKDGAFEMPTKEWARLRQRSINSLSWPDRHDLYSILLRYKKHLIQGRLNQFYQEFMNEYLAPETKMITPESFFQTKITVHTDLSYNKVEFISDGILWTGIANLSIGLDLASSVSDTSDDTVITVAGYARCYPKVEGIDWQSQYSTMKEGKIFPLLVHIEGGKYSVHDYQGMKGVCEAVYALLQRYKIDFVKMEANGQQQQIAREIDTYLQERKIFGKVWSEYVSMAKADRILSIILPIIQRYGRLLCNPNPLIEKVYFQTLTVGMADHDDYADSPSIAFKSAVIPAVFKLYDNQKNEVKPTRYQEAYKVFGANAWEVL